MTDQAFILTILIGFIGLATATVGYIGMFGPYSSFRKDGADVVLLFFVGLFLLTGAFAFFLVEFWA